MSDNFFLINQIKIPLKLLMIVVFCLSYPVFAQNINGYVLNIIVTALRNPELRKGLSLKAESARKRGDVMQALSLHLLALHIAKQIGDKAGAAESLHSIGYIYKLQNNYDLALEY